MEYIQLTFTTDSVEQNEMLIAMLSESGFEGFEEKEPGLIATIAAENYQEDTIRRLASQLQVSFTSDIVRQQNWNAIWEAGFHPVTVPGFCTVRAAFHEPAKDTPYEVIITPKMSFGTGHHATTFLMMEAMRQYDFSGRKVLDFGTGTGILAILAQKLGATDVFAVDNDEWSIENARENAGINQSCITIEAGSLEAVPAGQYDVILANINRNILLQYMTELQSKLEPGGYLLLSGILVEDEVIISSAATAAGMAPAGRQASNGWLCLVFRNAIG